MSIDTWFVVAMSLLGIFAVSVIVLAILLENREGFERLIEKFLK